MTGHTRLHGAAVAILLIAFGAIPMLGQTQASAAPTPPDSTVYVRRPGSWTGSAALIPLEPLVDVHGGRFRSPYGPAMTKAQFVEAAYVPGNRLDFFRLGKREAGAEFVGPELPRCAETDPDAGLARPDAADAGWNVAASRAVFPATASYRLDQASGPQGAQQLQLVRLMLVDSSGKPKVVPHLKLQAAFVVSAPSAKPSLVGFFRADSTTAGTEGWVLSVVISTDTLVTPASASVLWVSEGPARSTTQRSLYDILDITGDGFPELITFGSSYEGYDFAIYSRNEAGKWDLLYQSWGGAGC